jgi:hypothetical protein
MKASFHYEIRGRWPALSSVLTARFKPQERTQEERTEVRPIKIVIAMEGFLRLLKIYYVSLFVLFIKGEKEEAGNNELGSGKQWCRCYLLSR